MDEGSELPKAHNVDEAMALLGTRAKIVVVGPDGTEAVVKTQRRAAYFFERFHRKLILMDVVVCRNANPEQIREKIAEVVGIVRPQTHNGFVSVKLVPGRVARVNVSIDDLTQDNLSLVAQHVVDVISSGCSPRKCPPNANDWLVAVVAGEGDWEVFEDHELLEEIDRDELDEMNSAIERALRNLLSSIGGGKKECGHQFDCVCAGDQARAALNELQEFRNNPGGFGVRDV